MRVEFPIDNECYFVIYMEGTTDKHWESYRGMGKYTGDFVYDESIDRIWFEFELNRKGEISNVWIQEGFIYTHGI